MWFCCKRVRKSSARADQFKISVFGGYSFLRQILRRGVNPHKLSFHRLPALALELLKAGMDIRKVSRALGTARLSSLRSRREVEQNSRSPDVTGLRLCTALVGYWHMIRPLRHASLQYWPLIQPHLQGDSRESKESANSGPASRCSCSGRRSLGTRAASGKCEL